MWHFYRREKFPPSARYRLQQCYVQTLELSNWALEQDAQIRFMQPICCEDKHGRWEKNGIVSCKLLRYFLRVSLKCYWSWDLPLTFCNSCFSPSDSLHHPGLKAVQPTHYSQGRGLCFPFYAPLVSDKAIKNISSLQVAWFMADMETCKDRS